MKKPYIKKYSKISKFTVWIVDGKFIRGNIDEEFTNCGQHRQFKFIPENEFWIDKENAKSEARYYINSMLIVNRLMEKGISHDEAVKKADEIERKERAKSKLVKELIKKQKDKKEVIEKVHKKLLKEFSKNLNVWLVHGDLVRSLFFLDFTEGGHEKVYHFVPQNEVWIDDQLDEDEIKFVLLHELHERYLMFKGKDYDHAHHDSSKIEYFCRHHPEELDKALEKEAKRNPVDKSPK